MDKKELIIVGVIVIIAVIAAAILFTPSTSAKDTTLDVLNKKELGENGTVYVKLTDDKKTALSGEKIHITLTNDKNDVVYNKTVETHATGVALAELKNISTGEYNLNVSYDGNENYTGCNISQKLTIKGDTVDDGLENNTEIQDTLNDTQHTSSSSSHTQTQSSSSSSPSSSSPSSSSPSSRSSSSSGSSSRSSSDGSNNYVDVNGHKYLPEYDVDGNRIN